MKSVLSIFMFTVVIIAGGYAYAGQEKVKLKLENMTCSSCSYMVEKSLKRVKGVSSAEVSFAKKRATVIFDNQTTNKKALIEATSNAGFPSKVIDEKE